MLLSILPGSGVTLVTTLLQLPAQLNTLELHLPGEIFNFCGWHQQHRLCGGFQTEGEVKGVSHPDMYQGCRK